MFTDPGAWTKPKSLKRAFPSEEEMATKELVKLLAQAMKDLELEWILRGQNTTSGR